MTNAPESRQTHVVRIAFTNKAGDVLSDKSIDVERFEVAKSATKSSQGFWQGLQRLLRWSDDPDADDYREEGTPSRDTEIVKVCDVEAEANPDDPEEWAPVRIIKSLKSRGGSAGDQNYQDRHVNDETVLSRKVTVRKIVHYDTNIDDAAQAAFDADPTRKAYVVKGKDYTRDDTTKDDAQYVEHEIVEFFKPRTNERDRIVSQVNQGVQVNLQNQYLIDESDDPDNKVVGSNGINPPFRLDPYQNIINVQFKSGGVFVIGDSAGYIWRCEVKGKSTKLPVTLERVGQVGPSGLVLDGVQLDPGNTLCASYTKIDGTPTFVLGGLQTKISGDRSFDDGLILISNDGRDWTVAKRFPGTVTFSRTPFYMVWDPVAKQFYANVATVDFSGDPVRTTECWSSPTGEVWTSIDVVAGNVPEPVWNAHCKYKHTNTALWGTGFGLADGMFGVDKSKKDSHDVFPLGHLVDDGLLISFDDMPFSGMYVCFVGSTMWMRVDQFLTRLQVSFDSGATWANATSQIILLNPDDNPFTFHIGIMVGAPRSDIRKV